MDCGKDAIEKAKQQYWNEQKARWRKEQRLKTKSVTVVFTKAEYAKITKQAKRYSLSRTKYTHNAALAYSEHKTLVLDNMTANYVREALILNYHMLRNLRDQEKITTEGEVQVLNKLAALQHEIIAALENPKRLEHAITELIHTEPEYKVEFIELIKNL